MICGGIQTAVLLKRLEDNPEYFTSGFAARFLLTMPPVEAVKLNDYEISEEERSSYERFIRDILSARQSTLIGNKVFSHVFPLSPAAWDTLVEYQHRHADLAIYEKNENAAVEGKFTTNAARIALILHVAGLVEQGTSLSELTPVSGDTMHNACIVTEWFIDEAKRIYETFAAKLQVDGTLTDHQRAVMKVLRRRNVPMTSSEIRGGSNHTKRLSPADIERALAELKQSGHVTCCERHHERGKGRPATEYKIPET